MGVTKSLDWYSPHLYTQVPIVNVNICYCGKWPMHHIHTDYNGMCTCDDCNPEVLDFWNQP